MGLGNPRFYLGCTGELPKGEGCLTQSPFQIAFISFCNQSAASTVESEPNLGLHAGETDRFPQPTSQFQLVAEPNIGSDRFLQRSYYNKYPLLNPTEAKTASRIDVIGFRNPNKATQQGCWTQ